MDVSGNYWGDGVTAADIAGKIDSTAKVDDYYADAGMTELVTVGGTPVSTVDQLEKGSHRRQEWRHHRAGPGEYNGNIHFAEKSLTIRCQRGHRSQHRRPRRRDRLHRYHEYQL